MWFTRVLLRTLFGCRLLRFVDRFVGFASRSALLSRGSIVENSFSCADMLNWVLKLFSLRVIMSKVRIGNSGGRFFPPPFFCQAIGVPLLNLAVG